MVTDGTLLKVYAWYDNEVGYACRMVDLANIVDRARRLMSNAPAFATTPSSPRAISCSPLTDGALRMLVLLHFYGLGYTPFMLAFLFLLYETAGIFANLGGGWLAVALRHSRACWRSAWSLQIGGLLMLSALDPAWGAAASVAWVVAAQGIAGVAKDLTKTASKSAIKATSQQGAGQLFRWVAWFTGSKNAMKGAGFFIGGLLLQVVGFRPALWLMAAMLAGRAGRRGAVAAAQPGQGEILEKRPRVVRQDARHQPDGSGARVHVRLARRLVRGRAAGVPVRLWLAVHAGRRLRRGLDHRLWRGAGDRPGGGHAAAMTG